MRLLQLSPLHQNLTVHRICLDTLLWHGLEITSQILLLLVSETTRVGDALQSAREVSVPERELG